jgi:hypothetical protein
VVDIVGALARLVASRWQRPSLRRLGSASL